MYSHFIFWPVLPIITQNLDRLNFGWKWSDQFLILKLLYIIFNCIKIQTWLKEENNIYLYSWKKEEVTKDATRDYVKILTKSVLTLPTYIDHLLFVWINMNNVFFSFSMCWGDRLIKEGYCDRGSAPSVSAISRLLRGHDGDDTSSEKKISDGKFLIFV